MYYKLDKVLVPNSRKVDLLTSRTSYAVLSIHHCIGCWVKDSRGFLALLQYHSEVNSQGFDVSGISRCGFITNKVRKYSGCSVPDNWSFLALQVKDKLN